MMTSSASQSGKRILIVEDDDAMSVALRDAFESEEYSVILARDGAEGFVQATDSAPDLIVLDVMLPRVSGLDICRRLRSEGDSVPIIMLTARGQEADRVLGLKLGADDYVTKPFSLLELLARTESLLRRAGGVIDRAGERLGRVRFGDVVIDFARHQATKGGVRLTLSAREFLLLDHFVRHRGQVVSRDQLLDSVWGYDHIPFTRTVDTHIAKLRKKIEENPGNPRFLLTVHRLGYKFTG